MTDAGAGAAQRSAAQTTPCLSKAGRRTCSSDFQRLLSSTACSPATRCSKIAARVRYLLHPSDATTGVRYSSLAMIHAILEDMLTPEQAREHLAADRRAPAAGRTACACSTGRCRITAGRSASSSAPRARRSSAARSASCTCTRICATRRRWRTSAMRERFFRALCQANPDRHPLDRAERDAAPGELLLLELGRRVRRSLPGERGIRARRARRDRARRRLARVFQRRRHRARADRAAFPRAEHAKRLP